MIITEAPLNDLSVEEKIAKSANDLFEALSACDPFRLNHTTKVALVIAAIPEITKHYLKGQ